MERDLTVQQPQFGRSARLYGHKPRSSVGRRVRQGDGLAARWAPPNLGLHRNRAVPPDNGVGSRFRAARHVSRSFVDQVKTPDMGGQVLAEVTAQFPPPIPRSAASHRAPRMIKKIETTEKVAQRLSWDCG